MVSIPRKTFTFFIAPTIALMLFIGVYPMIYSLYISFHHFILTKNTPPVFIGFDNFIKVLTDSSFHKSVANTLTYTGIVVPLDMLLGLGLALLLAKKLRFSTYYRIIVIIPTMMAPVAAAWLWKFIYYPTYGLFDTILTVVGIGPQLLTSRPETALLALVIVDIWQFTPFTFLIFYSALLALPITPFEAAQMDGASAWQKFRHLTLPMLAPVTLVILLLRLTQSLVLFDAVFAITQGGPGYATHTVSFLLWRIGMALSLNIGYASAMSWYVNFLVVGIAIILIRSLGRMTR